MARIRKTDPADEDEGFTATLEDILQGCKGLSLEQPEPIALKKQTSPRKVQRIRVETVILDTETEDEDLMIPSTTTKPAKLQAPDDFLYTKRKPLSSLQQPPAVIKSAEIDAPSEAFKQPLREVQVLSFNDFSRTESGSQSTISVLPSISSSSEAVLEKYKISSKDKQTSSRSILSRFERDVRRVEMPTSRPTSSSSDDPRAVLSYDPPRRRSPHKISARPRTPSPPSSPTKSKLISPSKSVIARAIPPTPGRPSIDVFWAQDITNDWNDRHSPSKTLASPKKQQRLHALSEVKGDSSEDDFPSPSSSPRKSPTKRDRAEVQARRDFQDSKHARARDFLDELDAKITHGRLAEITAQTGGVKIEWSKKLNTTAGRASWKRKRASTSKAGDSPPIYVHTASIELAEKIIDDEARLLNTLAHEFCHLANFMISEVKDRPHGKEFKEWAAKVSRTFKAQNIVVTTKHDYEIDFKYIWQCSGCGIEYKRHSKSIDPLKQSCGGCKQKLVQTKPVPRANAGKLTDYQAFVKRHFQEVKGEDPGGSHAAVMEKLGRMYREQKGVYEGMSPSKADATVEVEELADILEVVVIDDD